MEKYNSITDTKKHADRVKELMGELLRDLIDRSLCHDESKMQPPEVTMFDEFTPKLKNSTYGSDEYKGFLKEMGVALEHHYAPNPPHPPHL